MALLKKRKSQTAPTESQARPAEEEKVVRDKLGTQAIAYYSNRERGRANIDFIPISEIDPDPTNPRSKGITDVSPLVQVLTDFLHDRLQAGLDNFLVISPKEEAYDPEVIDSFDQQMARAIASFCKTEDGVNENWHKLFNNLEPLRENIRLLGVKQPIEVIRTGKRYRVTFGHRRLLASILAGEKNIPANVLAENTQGGKHTQASENLLQEGLTLDQRLDTIEAALAELGLDVTSNRTHAAKMLGLERTVIARCMNILEKGSPLLRQYIHEGIVTDIKKAASYIKLSDAELQVELGLEKPIEKKAAAGKKREKGRPAVYIKTPKIKDPKVIQLIMDKFGYTDKVNNWFDKDEINKAWAALVAELEKQCRKGG